MVHGRSALRAPGFHAAGVTLPGLPLIVAGHNEHVAWGFTALEADVQDLYYEKLDGKGNYEGNDAQWHPLTVDREVIHVRGGNDVVLEVQSTEHGPLMNPILAASDPPIALKWTLYDPSLNALPLYEMNMASNWTEFSAALASGAGPRRISSTPTTRGTLRTTPSAAFRCGRRDLLTCPFADGAHEWQGYIPFDQMPNAFDPPSGFLATANPALPPTSRPTRSPTSGWILTASSASTKRSTAATSSRPRTCWPSQTDIYSEVDQEMGHRFAYAIDHTPGPEGNGDPRMRQAADLMRSWDGRLTVDSAAASLVTRTRAALWPLILEPKLGKLAERLPLGRGELCRGRDRDARQAGVAAEGLQELGCSC